MTDRMDVLRGRLISIFFKNHRETEWLSSIVMFNFAVTMMLPGDTLAVTPAFSSFVAFGFTEQIAVGFCMIVSVTRMLGLIVNGAWIRSPGLRSVTAISSVPMFLVLSVGSAMPYGLGHVDAPSTATGTYIVLAVFDLLSARRSGEEARNARMAAVPHR